MPTAHARATTPGAAVPIGNLARPQARDALSHDRTADASRCRRVFRARPQDSERIWAAIAAAVLRAPVSVVRDRAPHGVVCGVDVTLTINDRTGSVATAWHYPDPDAAPRLVTAYPSA